MRSILILIIIAIALFSQVACSGQNLPEQVAAIDVTDIATSMPTTATVEPTSPPPTEEPTLLPSATAILPTSTPEPTVEPTKEPLPEISPATLIGLFNQFDFEAGGDNWLMFYEDGTFAGRHGPAFDTGIHVTDGTYSLEGDMLTLVDPDSCPTGESYRLEYRTQAQVHFEVTGEVTCDYLADDFERQPNWKRIDP